MTDSNYANYPHQSSADHLRTLIQCAATIRLTAEYLPKINLPKTAHILHEASEDIMRIAIMLRSEQTAKLGYLEELEKQLEPNVLEEIRERLNQRETSRDA